MLVLAWLLAIAWGLALLGQARTPLRPTPARDHLPVPEYTLWLPEGGRAPLLSPAPSEVVEGPVPPKAERPILALGAGVEVTADLPQRLSAVGDFVSVVPRPRGGVIGLAIERLIRDFAGPLRVAEPRDPAGYADARCAWLSPLDLSLPGEEAPGDPILRAARARKAHGLPVDLREGGVTADRAGPAVWAAATTVAGLRRRTAALTGGDVVIRGLLTVIPLALCLGPLALLWPEPTRLTAALALGLGTAARAMAALRDRFGAALPLAGWLLEPLLALVIATAPRARRVVRPMPELPAQAPPRLTAARNAAGSAWIEASAVGFLARRLGGAAPVMEQIYSNVPCGRSFIGRVVDRGIHLSPAARAVRFRRWAVISLGRAVGGRVLSVPCGGATDAAALGARALVLVDPDPAARALAAAACPEATVVDGTVETAPPGPFDLILYVGLAEYLDDAEVARQLASLRQRLAPAGVLITSTTAEHPQREAMAARMGWHTRARRAEGMIALLDVAGLRVDRRYADPWGAQWVFLARAR